MSRIFQLTVVAALYIVTTHVDGLVILYDSLEFEGRFYQNTPTEECFTLPSYGWGVASSLKTDQCIVVYTLENCTGVGANTILPGEYPDLKEIQRPSYNYDNKIRSYHKCTHSETLSVELHTGYDEDSSAIVYVQDICGCVNLPLYSHGKVNRLWNGWNCIKLYSELDCRGSNIEIPGGWGPDTGDLRTVGFDAVTKSVSGCGVAASYVRLSATIQNFTVKAVPDNDISLPKKNDFIQMAPNVTFINDGVRTVDEEYEAAKEVEEWVAVTLNSDMRSIYRSTVSENLEIESDVGIPIFSVNELSSILSVAYTFSNGPGGIAREKVAQNRTRLYAVKEKVPIPPCSTYTLSSSVKYSPNYPVYYEFVAEISGVTGDKVMTSETVKAALGENLEYVKDLNENVIIVKGNGTITASFGIEAVLVGKGTKIPACGVRVIIANLIELFD